MRPSEERRGSLRRGLREEAGCKREAVDGCVSVRWILLGAFSNK